MRLCRFSLDDVILSGFYYDQRVIPIDQAAEAYCDEAEVELLLPSTSDLLDILPPDGSAYHAIRDLARWVDDLDVVAIDELAVPIEDVQVLVPIERPSKLLLLAGNYAEHIVEGGGTSVERE
jgi:hypothetical protein